MPICWMKFDHFFFLRIGLRPVKEKRRFSFFKLGGKKNSIAKIVAQLWLHRYRPSLKEAKNRKDADELGPSGKMGFFVTSSRKEEKEREKKKD